MTHDWALKLIYITLLFAPLLFAPLRSGATAASTLLLVPFLLSNYRAYYMIGAHYPLYFMPLIFISAAYFLRRRGNKSREAATMMLVSTTVFALILSPISPASLQLNGSFLWYPHNSLTQAEVEGIHAILNTIPENASILTQNHIFPHISGRMNAYAVPVTTFSEEQLPAAEAYLKTLIARSDYVLLDPRDGAQLTPLAVRLTCADPDLKPAASTGNVTLYARRP